MVTINATLLIELVLFLIFLWGTQRYILAPVLRNIDERDDLIETNIAQSESNTLAAENLEKKYRHEIAVIRRNAEEEIRQAQQKSQREHTAFLVDERVKAEKMIAGLRNEAQILIEAQRDDIATQVPGLVEKIQTKLTNGGDK